jgi:acetyl-CoA carboxylase alpha subunit
MTKLLSGVLERQLRELSKVSAEDLLSCRYKKFRAMGAVGE